MTHYFNKFEGKMIVGEAAYEEAMLTSSPGDIVPLVELVDKKSFDDVDTSYYDSQPFKGHQSREECIIYGKWIINILQQSDSPKRPTLLTRHIRHFSLLSLGMSEPFLLQPFGGNVRAYRQAVGEKNSYSAPNTFADWTAGQFAHNAEKLSIEVGGKPTETDYERWASRGNGPGRNILRFRGGISWVNDLIGYPDTRRMDREDCIDWCVRVMRANDGRPLSRPIVCVLSARKRGFSDRVVYSRFGTYDELIKASQREYEERLAGESRRDDLKVSFDRVIELLQPDTLDHELPEENKRAIAGKYEVATACLPRHSEAEIALLAVRSTTTNFIQQVRDKNKGLTAADVEIMAETLNVYDEIWPPEDLDRIHLRVSDEEIAAFRVRDLASKRKRRPRNQN